MFSIAAINDTDSSRQWEPLAPTKEAQEFYISQIYHEGLLKLQAKDYSKARELLEAVLENPLIASSTADSNASDGLLLQLRFLSLKNLATVFVQQGATYYEKALHCYLQAIEIDSNDAVLWNQLGTLSCTMGLLSTSRWAFEQGLLWSPNNWNCMEKLMEVLIAIGDEVSCLSMADLILTHWPSHARALHVKSTIENSETVPLTPRGIDKLEPKHVKLKFPDKRKAEEDSIYGNATSKRPKQNILVELAGATWTDLIDSILGIILETAGKACEQGFAHDDTVAFCGISGGKNSKKVFGDTNSSDGSSGPQMHEKIEGFATINIDLRLPSSHENIMHSAGKKGQSTSTVNANTSNIFRYDKLNTMNEEEIYDKEQPQERRSTRLERLRSRKSGKEELEFACGKDLAKVYKLLGPFVLSRSTVKDGVGDGDCATSSCFPYMDSTTLSANENTDVAHFISGTSTNLGAYHMGHLLLEEVSHAVIPFHDSLCKVLQIEKMTRHWGTHRTPSCSLFLAELCYDHASCTENEPMRVELFSDAAYHMCKVIELVAFDPKLIVSNCYDWNLSVSSEFSGLERPKFIVDGGTDFMKAPVGNDDPNFSVVEDSLSQEPIENGPSIDESSFWVRFFWLNGHLSLYYGFRERALNEFCICLLLLKNLEKLCGSTECVVVPHCRLVKLLHVDLVQHEINLLKLDSLVKSATTEYLEKGMYRKCIESLSLLLLSTKDVYLDELSCTWRDAEGDSSVELLGLETLMLACQKSEPMNVQVLLNSHRRKLQIHATAAGMLASQMSAKGKNSLFHTEAAAHMNRGAAFIGQNFEKVSLEVQHISRSASLVKNVLDQMNTRDLPCSLVCIIAELQHLLLAIMCSAVRMTFSQKASGLCISNEMDQMRSGCLADAAIAFCKLQQLDPSVHFKTQVDLIVAVHELLAEYGLCCTGNDSGGEEGSFLKLAIKHLLALNAKVKSLNGRMELGTKLEESASYAGDQRIVLTEDGDKHGNEKNATLKKVSIEINTEVDGIALCVEDDLEKPTNGNATDVELTANEQQYTASLPDGDVLPIDAEMEEIELGIESALDQCFFCLYGLNINPDSCNEDELAVHKNTSRADYQTKEQCADVFQYILPYAKALSRAGLIKLRRVLRAIRKHFPQPPNELLADNPIKKFLDGPDICEDGLSDLSMSGQSSECILNILFPNKKDPEGLSISTVLSSHPYIEVYSNLYYFIAQAEDISSSDKYPGFVLKKEGEEFVEQNANMFMYDLLYNPLRFESWQKLANIFDEEVDLLLNDGSKNINIVDWRKNTSLVQRVENGRRRSRRCLLMSLALANTPAQQSQIHELLALVYYDNIQNVVPFYDQRSIVPTKDAVWMKFCQKSMEHFKKAFSLEPDWIHAFYLGKLCEKMGYSPDEGLSYYSKSASLNPSAVDPVYRLHASRLKLLYSSGKQNLSILQIVATHAFNPSTKEKILENLKLDGENLQKFNLNVADDDPKVTGEDATYSLQLDEAWHILYDDCLSALEICMEGDLKHFHKSRYMMAQGLYQRAEARDLERSKDELSFCFKSTRSSFTVNMWEIDGTLRKGRRKNPGLSGNKKILEVTLSESSRKFMTCMRKYLLLYLTLLEKTGDFLTLERAYSYLRSDKRFFLCLGDIVPIALGKYIQVLASSISNAESDIADDKFNSLEQMLEKMFNILMDHGHLWSDMCSIPEVNGNPELSEASLSRYIHQYIQLLESNCRLDSLEAINEKIRKRFKNPKLSSNTFSKTWKHASLSWFRSVIVKLVSITQLTVAEHVADQAVGSEYYMLLFVDLDPDDLLSSPSEGPYSKGIDMNLYEAFSKMKNILIRQAPEASIEAAIGLLKSAYSFYKDCYCTEVPLGINLYAVSSAVVARNGGTFRPEDGSSNALDLSMPRKLLLWAYTLVHGRYSNISAVMKFCEENAKSRIRRGIQPSGTQPSPVHPQAGRSRERSQRDECGGEADSSFTMAALDPPNREEIDVICATLVPLSSRDQPLKSADTGSMPLLRQCSVAKSTENVNQEEK